MSNTCTCTSPPSVTNGAVKFAGPYTNGTKAEYDCDADYTNTGGNSLLCQAADATCTSTAWVVDATDSNSGYPNCQAVVPDYDVFNTYNNNGSSGGIGDYGLLILLGLLLLLLLIAVILMLWYWCCRERCRMCCINKCRCCRTCCYQIPYGQPYPGHGTIIANGRGNHVYNTRHIEPAPVHRGSLVTTTDLNRRASLAPNSDLNRRQSLVPNNDLNKRNGSIGVVENGTGQKGRSSPTTPRKVIVTERRETKEFDEDFFRRHYGYQPRNSVYTVEEIPGQQPKEFVRVNSEKLALPQNAKPVDTQGNPVWMPHASGMRTGANHMHTSTK